MVSLFRLFAGIILKTTLIFTLASILGVLALDKLFGGYEFYIGMLVFIGPLLAWALTFMLVPKNLDWIMSLPISKRNVLVLHYITNIFSSVCISIAVIFVLIVLTIMKSERHLHIDHLVKATSVLAAEMSVQNKNVEVMDIYSWMLVLLMISFFHALSISISRPTITKRLYLNLWNHANSWVRWGIRTGWIGIVVLGAIWREYFFSPFGVFVISAALFLLFTTFNTAHALAIPKRQKRLWMLASGGLAVVQIVFLFSYAIRGVKSDSFDQRVSSVMFLGPFSGGMERQDIARLLEAEIKADKIKDLGAMYKKKFFSEKKIKASQDSILSFERIIHSKKEFGDVLTAAALFDPSELTADDLSFLFAKLAPLANECHCEFMGYDYLQAKIQLNDITQFLASSNELAVQFALTWSRYHRNPALLSAVRNGLPHYSDKLKLYALKTLSVLYGKQYHFDDWLRNRSTRAISSEFLQVQCKEWSPKSVVELQNKDVGWINICIRERAENGMISEIENIGWFNAPFDARTQAVLHKVFHIH